MEEIAWTAIGLLAATLFGSFFYLGARIDNLGSRLDARIDAVSSDLGGRVDGLGARLDARLDGVVSRLDAINARLDMHIERHAG
ncbi:MAG TPA: hypothetical protein VJ922_03180 [Actinomycetota bacterium]|nr:hypothetical protein [Actinomycetota bacterium]